MNTKKLMILAAVALAAIGLGIWVAGNRSSSDSEAASTALYPELKKTINDATAIRIFTAGDKQSVQIERKDSAWVVTERNGYPADDAKVRKLLLSLANAKLREEKTSNPNNYASLGVEDVTAQGATGTRLEVAGVTPAVNVIVGKQGPNMESQYVRRTGEAQSWLVDSEIDSSSLPQDWLRKTLLDISADRIQSVSVQAKGTKGYTAQKNAKTDANFSVEGLPKGKKLSSPSAANTLAMALSGVSLADVQPAKAFDGTPDVTAKYQTFDGLVIELKGWSQGEKRYLAAQTQYDETIANRFKAAGESQQSAQSEAGAKSDEGVKAATPTNDVKGKPTTFNANEDAKSLNDSLTGWVFEIPEYKYNAIFKPLDDLIAD